MVSVTVDTSGINELNSALRGVRVRIEKSLQPALGPSAKELRKEIVASVRAQRGMNGEKWPKKKGRGKAIQGVADEVFVEPKDQSILLGVRGPGVYHQFGTPTLPARPFLPVDRDGVPKFEKGRARRWLRQTLEQISRYIMTGNTRLASRRRIEPR
ncbi:MAG: hypothetical protein AAGE52_01220 [Myxococcota bacterium]